jgi:hypothetical protein
MALVTATTLDSVRRAVRSRVGAVLLDTAIALTILIAATNWGTWYWNQSLALGRRPFFYQLYFEPAVMVACGKGFVVSQPQVPAIGAFLSEQIETFDCSQIPPGATLQSQNLFQSAYRYLMTATGLTWRVTGISFRKLGPLAGVLFGVAIAAAYGLFRLGMGRVLSALLAWLLSVSTLQVGNLPHILDYSKAPFILLLFFLTGLLVRMRPSWTRVLLTSAAAGTVLGIGYGFRSDPVIVVPAFIAALVLFLDAGWRRRLQYAAGGCLAFFAAFYVVGWPVIAGVQRTWNCQWHTVILGLGDAYTRELQLEPAPYDWLPGRTDEFVHADSSSYAARLHPGQAPIGYCSPEYGDVTRALMLDTVGHAPADTIVRAYGSALQMVQLPLRWRTPPMPHLAVDYYKARKAVTTAAKDAGLLIVLAAVFLITASSLRLGLFVIGFLLFFGGYPAVQFSNRHFFHLEFITWWAVGFLVQQLVSALVARVRHQPAGLPAASFRRAGLVMAGVFVALVGSLWLARVYQHARMQPLVAAYANAERDAIPLQRVDSTHRLAPLRARTNPETADLVELDVNESQCPGAILKFLYDAAHVGFANDILLEAQPPQGSTRIVLPVFSGFQGVRVAEGKPECVTGMQRFRHPERFTVMPALVLRPGWERRPLHQRLIGWGIEPPPDE